MAPRPGTYQASFVSGEIDPLTIDRTDATQYYRALRRCENAEVLPQGGVRNTPGLRQVSAERPLIARVPLVAGNLTVFGTGSAAVLVDEDPATISSTGALAAGDTVIITATFASSAVAAVDLVDYRAAVATTATIVVQWNDAGTWRDLFVAKSLADTVRTRRWAQPPRQPVTTTQVRVVVRGVPAGGLSNVLVGGLRVWTETGTLAPSRGRPFTRSRDQAYDLVFAPDNCDVFGAAGWLAAVPVPLTAAMIEREIALGNGQVYVDRFTDVQSFDTMILFHPDLRPWQLRRETADAREWDARPAPFANIPRWNYGDTYGNRVDEVWRIELTGTWTAEHRFTLTIGGEETASLQVAGLNWTAFATTLRDAIEALAVVQPGISVVYTGTTGIYTVTFSGTGNEGTFESITGRVLNRADAGVATMLVTRGVAGGEDIMSDTRGWPRGGLFYQQRLLMYGPRGVPNAVIASVAGDFFDLDTRLPGASAALVLPLDTDADETIVRAFAGRFLQLFTTEGEYWVTERAIAANEPVNVVAASRNGSAAHCTPVENEGATLFIHRNRSQILEFLYSDADQNYVAQNISLLSASLVDDVREVALRRAGDATDANLLHLVRKDGGLRVVSLLRAQEVTGFARRPTDGLFRSVWVNGRNEVMALVERTVAGQPRRFLERFDRALFVDQAVTRAPTGTAVTGLVDHEGATVWAVCDGARVEGPFTVTGGAITLARAATSVVVGRWIAPRVRTLPLPEDVAERTVLRRKKRVHTVHLGLRSTTSIAVAANDGPPTDVPLRRFDGTHDVPLLVEPVTGDVTLAGIPGHTDHGEVEITQLRPGVFTVLSIISEGG